MKKFGLALFRRLLKLLIVPFVFVLLFVEFSPVVVEVDTLSPNEITLARQKVSSIFHSLAADDTAFETSLSNQELSAISGLISGFTPRLKARLAVNRFGMIMAGSVNLPLSEHAYLNIVCMVEPGYSGAEFGDCEVGRIPVPSFVSFFIIKQVTRIVFSDEVAETTHQILTTITLSEDHISFRATKPDDFYAQVKESVDSASDIVSATKGLVSNDVLREKVQEYLYKLDKAEFNSNELAERVGFVMTLASVDTISDGQPALYNQAALWALSVKYGNPGFADFLNIEKSNVKQELLRIKGREDLSLHFLYSATLEQVSLESLGLGIGEFKEFLDSGSGGSGFSFADMAADIAGLEFAKYITGTAENAERAQTLLSGKANERLFFPAINDLLEGLSYDKLVEVIGEKGSKEYNKAIARVEDRVRKVPLYNKNGLNILPKEYRNPIGNNGKWYVVDTHMHTTYSDGHNSIDDLARQASNYGCNAIAITDHGDHSLKSLFSEVYYADIDAARKGYPGLTIMEGMEWNIPPYGGREHVTVLLPESENIRSKFQYFRNRFDHHHRLTKDMVSASPALSWLEAQRTVEGTLPVVLYNHPSRKDEYSYENFDDFISWESPVFLGFSGAPGHQGIRTDRNGAYNTIFKTIDGLDPVAAIPGGTWDQLLATGRRVLAARAGSDFHDFGNDYWPCQFSTTHIYSKSNKTNDILNALHSGNMWAQHGKFIRQLDFKISSAGDSMATMGEVVRVSSRQINISISIELAASDWQGDKPYLDTLQLIEVSSNGHNIRDISTTNQEGLKTILFNINLSEGYHYFRLQGKSKTKGTQRYQFWTNPIGVVL